MKGCVFNIQRYSLNDGEGIRTVVFLKGCKLHCPWCCNPESLSFLPEIIKKTNLCLNRKVCSESPDKCPSGALSIVGKYYSVDELVEEVTRDEVFFDTSGGGVTLSGGEVLWQHEFASKFLKALYNKGYHTAIETCGNAPLEHLKMILEYTNEVLFDLKILNEEDAKNTLGATLDWILDNFRYVSQSKKKLIARVPLIPGYTATDENIDKIIEFLKPLSFHEIHLLPYHKYGIQKYSYLNMDYPIPEVPVPTEEFVQNIVDKFKILNKNIVIGG